MLIQCPQCFAELVADAKECFACGCILEEWAGMSAPKTEPKKEIDFIGKSLQQSPKTLSMGVTFKGQYTIRQPQESSQRWILYEVLDQQSGHSSLLQIGSQNHPVVASVVERVQSIWKSLGFSKLLDTGDLPAPFFIYEVVSGQTLKIWKRQHRAMSDRISMCTQMLSYMVQWSKNGLCFSSFDSEKMFVVGNDLILHPMLLSVEQENEIRSVLEWMYEMLSFRSMASLADRFPMEGLSIRYAQWMHLMLRRNPTIHAMYRSWEEHIHNNLGRSSKRCSERLENTLLLGRVQSDFDHIYDLDLDYVRQEQRIFGSKRCIRGKVLGYIDRVLLAYEGLFFAPDVAQFSRWYQEVVLDEYVDLSIVESDDFESLLIQTKIDFLQRRDWEFGLARLLRTASTFAHWMEINRFRVIFGVRSEKIVIPNTTTVDEKLQLASFFYWFCDDEEEGLSWYREAKKMVEDVYEAFQICETELALFSKIDPDSMLCLRTFGKEASVSDQLIILEEMEDRLDMIDTEWLGGFVTKNIADKILWCSSRFAPEADIIALNRYCQSIRNQLRGFGFTFEEEPDWKLMEEEEQILQAQLQFLLQITKQNKQYEELGFPIPPLVSPFSQTYIDERREYLSELIKKREEEEEALQNKQARRDGFVIVGLLLIVGLFFVVEWFF